MSSDFKLFVGNLPPDATEDEIFTRFKEFGTINEVYLMSGGRSRSGQSSAFVKYYDTDSCERAIAAMNMIGKLRTQDRDTVVVKYAKSQARRSAPYVHSAGPPVTGGMGVRPHHTPSQPTHTAGCKLFVGGLPDFVDRDDLIAIFCPFGHVESVHLMQGKSKSGQACAFITYQIPGPAEIAIRELNGRYRMEENSVISVRFADSDSTAARAVSEAKRMRRSMQQRQHYGQESMPPHGYRSPPPRQPYMSRNSPPDGAGVGDAVAAATKAVSAILQSSE